MIDSHYLRSLVSGTIAWTHKNAIWFHAAAKISTTLELLGQSISIYSYQMLQLALNFMDYSWNTYQYHAKQYKSWQLFKYLNQIKGTWVRLRSKRRKRQEFSFFISEHVIVLPYGISPPRTGNSITNFFSITQHIEHKLRNASFYFLPIPWLQSGLNEGVIIWLKVWEETGLFLVIRW